MISRTKRRRMSIVIKVILMHPNTYSSSPNTYLNVRIDLARLFSGITYSDWEHVENDNANQKGGKPDGMIHFLAGLPIQQDYAIVVVKLHNIGDCHKLISGENSEGKPVE
jgi:hypothetical protein